MKVIAIDLGHGIGRDRGASDGFMAEETIIDIVGPLVIKGLLDLGIEVIETRPTNATAVIDSLMQRIDKSNTYNVDLFVSIHANAGEGEGSEVFTFNGKELVEAKRVLDNLVGLGFTNRGIKASNLYVINKTIAPSMLIEICFTDTKSDVDLYNSIGAEKIAKAIVEGITGQISTSESVATPMYVEPSPASVIIDSWIGKLQAECNNQGFSDQVVDGISGPNTLKGCPTIKIGAQGNITELLQEKLGIIADGDFGNQTRQSVINFQSNNGLVADGIVGQATWSKLLGI